MDKGGVREVPEVLYGVRYSDVDSMEETGGSGEVLTEQEDRGVPEKINSWGLVGYGVVKDPVEG